MDPVRTNRARVGAAALALAVAVVAALVWTVADPGRSFGVGAGIGEPTPTTTTTAPPPEPSMSMSGDMRPGQTVTATGDGFAPGSRVTLSMDGTAMATADADSLGKVAFSFVIPMDMVPGPKVMSMTGVGLTGTAVNLSAGVTIGALTGQLAPQAQAQAATPMAASPSMTG